MKLVQKFSCRIEHLYPVITRIGNKHPAVGGYVNSQRAIEFTGLPSAPAERKFGCAVAADYHNAVIDAIDQVQIAVGSDGDVAWLVGFRLYIEKKSGVFLVL